MAPLLTSLAPLGMAPLFIVVTLTGLYDCWRQKLWSRFDRQLAVPLLLLALLGSVSTFWAIDKVQTFRTSLVLAAEFTGGLTLMAAAMMSTRQEKRRIARVLAIGIGLAIGLFLIEHLTPGYRSLFGTSVFSPMEDYARLNSLSRGLTFTTLLLVPVTIILWRQGSPIAATLLFLAGAFAVFTSHSLASKLALPVAMLVSGLFFWRTRLAGFVCAVVASLVVLGALPLALQIPDSQTTYDRAQWLPSSGHHRLTIWSFAARNAVTKPLFGWALDASRVIPDADDEVVYIRKIETFNAPIPEAQLPLHPHSAPIQIWLELGAAGAILTVAVLVVAFHRLGACHRSVGLANAPALAAGFVVACVSYGIWQSWWQGTIWISVALLAAINAPEPARDDA
ncbi:MAG: O-antigen ligase family protein [Magnetospirillum gryphiswaldense]|nr:O-antigen ligase family protein [Magnetospirillum gryphiswaldense]